MNKKRERWKLFPPDVARDFVMLITMVEEDSVFAILFLNQGGEISFELDKPGCKQTNSCTGRYAIGEKGKTSGSSGGWAT